MAPRISPRSGVAQAPEASGLAARTQQGAALLHGLRIPRAFSKDPRAFTRAFLFFSLVLLLLLPATAQQSDRAKTVGHRMFCMCGCKQILVECNHVGCTMSTSMLKKLDAEVASGKSDDLILQSFVQQFGAEVVAEPPAKGFNWLAWIMPFAALGAGFLLVRSVLTRWTPQSGTTPAMPSGPAVAPDVLARIRQESEEDE